MLSARTNDGKDLVLIIAADRSGCSHYRLRWNSLFLGAYEHLGFTPIVLPYPMFDAFYLSRAKAIIFQRPVHDDKIEFVRRYKTIQPKYGYKMIFETDDQVFSIDGEVLPEYNTASRGFNKDEVDKNCATILPWFDEIVVSTEYLKEQIEKKFDVHNVTVIKNVIPRFMWSFPRKKEITEDLKKPTILYSGSPCHYQNPVPKCQMFPNGLPPLKGDFDNVWLDWVIKNVREHKINFVVMGGLPWFFEPIKDEIYICPWVDTNSFPRQVMDLNADFCIAPLVENSFNKCKSSLRFYESCASGMVFLGTVFKDSPYHDAHPDSQVKLNCTYTELDEQFWKLCKKENYNKVLNWQYSFINTSGTWLESDKHVNQWLNMIDNQSTRKDLI